MKQDVVRSRYLDVVGVGVLLRVVVAIEENERRGTRPKKYPGRWLLVGPGCRNITVDAVF